MRRSKQGLMVAALCVAGGACGAKEGGEQPAEPGTQEPSPAVETTAKLGQSPPAAGETVEPAPAMPLAVLKPATGPALLATQLGHKMSEYTFLGWTADGNHFALETVHGEYGWDREKDKRTNSSLQVMRMRIVYDTLTQRAVARYQVSNKLGKRDKHRKKLLSVWQEAKDSSAWKVWLAANPLTKPKPSPTSPDGRWKLTAKIEKRSIHKFTAISLKRRKGGFYTSWPLWQTNHPDGTDPVTIAVESEGAAAIKPRIVVESRKGTEAWTAIRYRIPWSDDQQYWMGASDGLVIRGNLRAFWAPGGGHYLLATFHKNSDDTMFPERREAAFFVRVPGPQIALRDGGAGIAKVRAKAAELAAAGMPVQQVSDAKAPVAATTVYYRGDAKAMATQIASKLGTSKIEKLAKKGWLDVVVVLGPG